MTEWDWSLILLGVGVSLTGVWLITTGADGSSALGIAGNAARTLAIGFLIGAGARLLWERRR